MEKNLLKILKFTGFLLIGLLLLYLAFRGISFERLITDLKSAKYSWVILSLFFAFLAYVSRAIRWNLIIEPLNYKPALKNTFYSMMVGYLANFAFPRIGEITRCAVLAKKEKIPTDKLIGTVIIERGIDFLTLLFLIFLLVIFRFETFGTFFRETVFNPLSEKLTGILGFSWILWLIAGLLTVLVIVLYYVFRTKLSTIHIISRIKKPVKGVFEGLKTVYKMKKAWKFLLHTIIIWGMYWLMTWVVVFSLSATSQLGLIDGLFLLLIGGLGMSAPVQNGYGAYHWIVSRGIVGVYGGISLEEGLAFATISHESQAVLAILLGSLSFLLLFRKSKNMRKSMEIVLESTEAESKTA